MFGRYLLKVSGVEMVVQSLLELGQGQVDRRGNRPKSDLVRFPHVHQKDVLQHVHFQQWPSGCFYKEKKTYVRRLLGNGLQLLVGDDGVLGPL